MAVLASLLRPQAGIMSSLIVPANCDGITDVAISSSGYATVFAQTFDDGTIDNCCIDHFEVRRMDDPCDDGEDDTVFGPSVTFCCEDAGEEVMVIFRAFDCFGNYNDCMVSVQVNDKIGVVNASCPPSQRISCNWYQDNLEAALTATSRPFVQLMVVHPRVVIEL